MTSIYAGLVLCCCALVGMAGAQKMAPAPSPAAAAVLTDKQMIADMTASDFVLAPPLMSTPNTSASINSQRQVAQWPALKGSGISQTAFILGACSLRPPHTHLRASGLLYLISGNIQVGFVSEEGTKAYVNNLTAGSSALFPQGLLHYQQNLGCDPAMYTISYNNEEPGTQTQASALMGLPMTVVDAALGWGSLPMNDAMNLMTAVPKGTFVSQSDPTCVAQCASAMTPTAPGVSVTTTVAGR